MVYWQPPEQALDKVKELVWEPSISRYGADEGLPDLRAALVKKVNRTIRFLFTACTSGELWLADWGFFIWE